MFEALERIPGLELAQRHAQLRAALAIHAPEAEGLMAFSRLGIYYLTGALAPGVVWVPREGEPVLLLRRGAERARLESPLEHILAFRSFGDLPGLAAGTGSPLGKTVAAELGGVSWALGNILAAKLPEVRFVSGDAILAMAQSRKTDWELAKMRLAGARHRACLEQIIPSRVRPGMTEREISHVCWEVFFEHGHCGIMRMGTPSEEIFLGHVAAGDSGNYPSAFDGPLGLRGEHPAAPVMGYPGQVWQQGQPLALDVGFSLEGYLTDKTQVLWAGSEGSIPSEVRRAHDFCVKVQQWVAARLSPEHAPSELYAHCVEWAAREGFAEGFMALAPNTVRFIGHGIGLAIDGWPVIAKGFDEPFEVGQAMAVEPKIGIPGVGMVGVENTFEVTSMGGRCLTGGDTPDDFAMRCVG